MNGLLAAMLLAWGGAEAAGLGKLSVQSALGQPLRAEIELLSVAPEEIGSMDARLASAEAFRQARIARSDAHGNLHFTIEQRPNGTAYLKVTSTAPVQDPFLDLLIELNWSSGRILREYTVLLDPPGEARSQVTQAAKPAVAASAAPTKPAKEAAAKPAVSGREASPEAPAPHRYGPVKSGETLRGIAGKVQHRDVSLEMMIASLYQSNKQAFANNNMNLLKKGQVLKVPDRDAVMTMFSPQQAKQIMREHAAAWQAYRGQVADAAEKSAAAPASPVAGKIAPAKPVEPALPAAASKDVLKLSKGEPGKAQPDQQSQQRIQTLEEELAAKSRALQEAQDRVAQLERTVNDLQKLAALKGGEAAAAKPAEAAPEAPATAAPPAAAPAPETPKPVPAVPAPVAAPEEASGWMSGLLQNPIYLGGLAAAALLSGLLGYMVVSGRRRKAMASFEQSVLSGGDQFKTAIFRTGAGKTVGGEVTREPVSELSRIGLGAIDTHEVDPIAEAEVYMAYGRDAQAEEILKAAMVKDPNRHEIQLKLLEIYSGRQDRIAFETQASELYAGLGGQPGPVWAKAAEMGRGLDPDNPLYQITGEAPATASEPVAEAVEEVAAPEPAAAEMVPVTEPEEIVPVAEPEPVAEEDHVIEFEMPDELPAAVNEPLEIPAPGAMAEATVAETPLDFEPVDIELEAPEELEPLPEAETAGVVTPAEPALPEEAPVFEAVPELELPGEAPALPDFDVSALDAAAESMASQPAPVPEMDFSDIDLDLKDVPGFGEEAAPAAPATSPLDPELWEEVNTKMDLAKAYLEMGDREGAREILQEILNEGDDQQKAEAGRLMADTE
jgi:pilus assembly protein FimV